MSSPRSARPAAGRTGAEPAERDGLLSSDATDIIAAWRKREHAAESESRSGPTTQTSAGPMTDQVTSPAADVLSPANARSA